MRKNIICSCLFILSLSALVCYSQERLLKFPAQWEFLIPANYIILTSDQQLIDIADPEMKINMSVTDKPNMRSLKDIAKETVALGESTVIIAYDNFFAHYRGDKEAVRKLLPDSEEYIKLMKQISDYLGKYGLGLELSLINPIISNTWPSAWGLEVAYSINSIPSIPMGFKLSGIASRVFLEVSDMKIFPNYLKLFTEY